MYVRYRPNLSPAHTQSSVHLERKGYFEEHIVKFYMAELAEALDYLRSKRIVHRYVTRLPIEKHALTIHKAISSRTISFSTRTVMSI